MGFLDKFKNNYESQDDTGNYKYITKLMIDNNYVVLDCDIVISSIEKRLHKNGLPILDNVVINGAGHSIDARGLARIFYIKEKNITLKNITFKNGFCDIGGAIYVHESGSLKIKDCVFIDNKSETQGGAIINFGKVILENVDFRNNNSDEGGAVNNQIGGELLLNNCSFKENNSPGIGGAIINFGSLVISDSNFEDNNSNKHAGAIHNIRDGKLKISKTNFIKNKSSGDGGAINNNGNSLQADECKFIDNRSGTGGGAIVNWGDSIINNSEFKGNFSKSGYDINFQRGSLKLSDVKFNYIKEKSIFTANDDLVTIDNCEFIEYDE